MVRYMTMTTSDFFSQMYIQSIYIFNIYCLFAVVALMKDFLETKSLFHDRMESLKKSQLETRMELDSHFGLWLRNI